MMHGTHFNIAHIEPSSQIYGPGKRFVVWFQGCTLACKGCWNVAMWSHKAKALIDRKELLAKILACSGITGVTFLGGEPLQQPKNLLWLVQSLKGSGLDIMLYSGYEQDELKNMPYANQILEHVDILVVGRYEQAQRNTSLQWRGSENQKICFLSDRYDLSIVQECNQVEIHIDEFGGLVTLGYPD